MSQQWVRNRPRSATRKQAGGPPPPEHENAPLGSDTWGASHNPFLLRRESVAVTSIQYRTAGIKQNPTRVSLPRQQA